MRLDWTDDSEDLTVYIRLHPRDEAERRAIIDLLYEVAGPDGSPDPHTHGAAMYVEDGRGGFERGIPAPEGTDVPALTIAIYGNEEER